MSKNLNSTLITVTFFGENDHPLYRLSKKYIVNGWEDKTDLRQLVDEIASEMNHLSGYGIFSIQALSNGIKFTIEYKDKFVPHTEEELHFVHYRFDDSLRFRAGSRNRGGGPVWLEIPRLRVVIPYNKPVQLYESGDTIFKIRSIPFQNRKERKGRDTKYILHYDMDNPYLISFCHKIVEGQLAPKTTTTFNPVQGPDAELAVKQRISWWYLPKAQTTFYQKKKYLQREEKRKKAEERERKQLEKAGIVYKDKKGERKAQQVYVIKMVNEGLIDAVVKIGISHSPGKRLQTLNTSSPFELELVHKFVAEPAEEAETKLHEKFDEYRMSGEWFKLPPDQISALREITEYQNGKFIKDGGNENSENDYC